MMIRVLVVFLALLAPAASEAAEWKSRFADSKYMARYSEGEFELTFMCEVNRFSLSISVKGANGELSSISEEQKSRKFPVHMIMASDASPDSIIKWGMNLSITDAGFIAQESVYGIRPAGLFGILEASEKNIQIYFQRDDREFFRKNMNAKFSTKIAKSADSYCFAQEK